MEDLEKAYDKSKLIPKTVTDKNGITRVVWVNPDKNKKKDKKPTKKVKEEKEKTTKPAKTTSSGKDKEKSKIYRGTPTEDLIKLSGYYNITWKESTDPRINRMRCIMALKEKNITPDMLETAEMLFGPNPVVEKAEKYPNPAPHTINSLFGTVDINTQDSIELMTTLMTQDKSFKLKAPTIKTLANAYGSCKLRSTRNRTDNSYEYETLDIYLDSVYFSKTGERNNLGKIHTVLHEYVHSQLSGKTTAGNMFAKVSRVCEEVIADLGSLYLADALGGESNKDKIPRLSYEEYVVPAVANIKDTEQFKDCTTLEEIGKVLWDQRVSGTKEVINYRPLVNRIKVNNLDGVNKFLKDPVLREWVSSNKNEILDTAIDYLTIDSKYTREDIEKYDLVSIAESIKKIEDGEDLQFKFYGNDFSLVYIIYKMYGIR